MIITEHTGNENGIDFLGFQENEEWLHHSSEELNVAVETVRDAAQQISTIVAPAIMISASALMILALQGKYSQLIDRLRALNEERRKLNQSENPSEQRLSNVVAQIEMILLRARLVRNSIVSLYTAISLFVLCSIVIGVPVTLNVRIPASPSIIAFMSGMVAVLFGTAYALRDIGHAYKVAQIEVRGVKELQKGK